MTSAETLKEIKDELEEVHGHLDGVEDWLFVIWVTLLILGCFGLYLLQEIVY